MQVIKFIKVFSYWLQQSEIHFVGCIIIEEYYIAYCYFSAMASPNVAAGQDSEIPVLEDILEEEVEMACTGKVKKPLPRWRS